MAIIYDNGRVWDFSFMNKTLVMRKNLFQLPKSKDYFGYSDENGILYFIHSDAEKSITKYHKSFSNQGHKIVGKSKRKEVPGHFVYGYTYGVLLGKSFWAFGRYKRCQPWCTKTGILFIDQVATDFFGGHCGIIKKGLERSWDFLVRTVWLHLFLCLHEYILTGK